MVYGAFRDWLVAQSKTMPGNIKGRNRPPRLDRLGTSIDLNPATLPGIDEAWLLSDSSEDAAIPDRSGGLWDPLQLLDPLVLGDFDFRDALRMAPRLVLQLALAIVENGCVQALQKNDTTPLVRLIDLIKRELDLHDPKLIADLTTKLAQPEYAGALELLA